ncbi:TolC family protein [Reichenbachiella versicolor]|uniref:TolC family protein n=1 Tax=Reichenbachiella versicolor TaxID=1821036 RepID=UPI000D6DFA60|nr:TolC family protein [Reichenbachiella versicolor]
MINRNILLALGVLLAYQVSFAQESPKTFTLDQAISFAIENNQQSKNAALDVEVAQREIDEVIARGLPQINGTADIAYNHDIRPFVIPAGAFDGTFDPNGTDVEASALGVPYTSDLNLSLEQLIIDGQFFAGVKAARVYADLARRDKLKNDIDVAEAVSKAYFLVLVNKERYELVENNFLRTDSLLRDTKGLYEGGFAEKIDVSRVQVQYNNVKVELDNYQALIDLSESLLLFQLGLNRNQKIDLTDKIEDAGFFDFSEVETFTYKDRVEFDQLNINKKLAEMDIKTVRGQYYPRIGLYAQLGTLTGARTGSRWLLEEWHPYSVIGLRATMPIFDGLMKRRQVQQRQLKSHKIDNQIDFLKNNIDVEIEQAISNYNREFDRMKAQKENMELAREVYDVAKLKYQEGVGSNIEVIDADGSYKEAQTNYFNALYDALISKIALQKAYGVLL